MTHAPAVSVIMANYNGARFLDAAIGSLMRQTLQSWELIFVDDASTDDSVAVAEAAANGDPRVRIIRLCPNRGPASARNRGLDAARGEWIAVFDSDDLMTPQRLELLKDRAEADDAALIADNLMLFSDSETKPRPLLRNRLGREPHWLGLADLMRSGRLYSRTPDLGYLKPMIRAKIIRLLNVRYDERLRIGEDYNFLRQILAGGHRLRFYPSATYLYRKHAMSISHRLSAADIRALIEADGFFLRSAGLSPEDTTLLERRKRTLELLLVYDRVINAMKAGDAGRGVAIALAHPMIWPLLTRPVGARLRRLLRPVKPAADAWAGCPNLAE